jgi:exodeoxyribonuclease III
VSKIENYPYTYWSFAEAAGHHGVGIISKVKPENVTYGLPIKDDDSEEDKKLKKSFNTEGRLIVAEYEKFILINAYVPNSGKGVKEGNMTKPYPTKVVNKERIHWDRILRTYLKELDAKKPIIVAGDMNVAHEEIDIANPKTNVNNAGFTKEEREDFTELLKETKLIDSFRSLYPDQKGAYSFWSYKFNNRQRNVGWRLDYFLISEKLKDSLVESSMRTKVLGSDHCPLVLFLHI